MKSTQKKIYIYIYLQALGVQELQKSNQDMDRDVTY